MPITKKTATRGKSTRSKLTTKKKATATTKARKAPVSKRRSAA